MVKGNHKFLLLGSSGVGKTSVIQQHVKKKFAVYEATINIGIEFIKIVIDNKENVLELWDTAGMERFDALGRTFYRGTHCCILVFDVTNRNSFRNINFWRDEFILHNDLKDPENFPFVVLANKVDLDSERQVSKEEAMKWCRLKSMPFYETSATDGRNLDVLFVEMLKKILKNNVQRPTEDCNKPIRVNETDSPRAPQDNNCCNNNTISFKLWPS